MARKDKYGKLQDKELADLLREIDGLYSDLANTVGFIGATSGGVDMEKPFALSDYPTIKTRIDKALQRLAKKLDVAIVNGVRSQWTLANKKNDELCRTVFGEYINKLSKEQARKYFNNNDRALGAFITRKENGLSLSQRVWKYAEQTKGEIEATLELGIKTGQDAGQMARDLKEYLKFPDKLFRRVRDEEGNLHLSKNAMNFHPGQGVYRSSYKNARRLAATETNIAYSTSDSIRYTQLDFIVGFRVNLSNNHTCLDSKGIPRPFYDICDELKGDYPKWFRFVGWHPQCRCFTTTILKTPEEVMRDSDGIDRGSVNEVKNLPPPWEDWVEKNQARIDRAEDRGTLPYFLRDNEWAWKEGVELDVPRPKTALLKAEERHAARTEEQIADIKVRWTERENAYDDARRVLRLADSIPDLAEYWKGDWRGDQLKNLRYEFNTGKIRSYDQLRSRANDVLLLIKDIRDDLDILDKPLSVMQKWGIKKAQDIQVNVNRTMGRYSSLPDKEKAEKYRFEAKWIEEHRKDTIPTWKEAQDAYLKAAKELEWKIEWEVLTDRLDTLSRDPIANQALVERARQYIGKDKVRAEEAIKDIEETIRLDVAKAKFKRLLKQHPKLLASFEDSMELALDPDDAERVLDGAKVFTDAWSKAELRALAVKKKIPATMWEPIQKAIDEDNYAELSMLVGEAENYAAFETTRNQIRELLKENRGLLENYDYKLVADLENDLLSGKAEDMAYIQARVRRANDIIREYEDAFDQLGEYRVYDTKSPAYLALVKDGEETLANNDLKGLKSVLSKLKVEKERLERDKAHAEMVEQEWARMSAYVARVKGLGVGDQVLDSLIASFEANYNGKKALKSGRADYQAIISRLAELGLNMGGGKTLAELKQALGNRMPKTLENLAKKIEDNMDDYTSLKASEEEIKKRLLAIFDENVPGMNVPFRSGGNDAANAIFQSYFKSQIETGTGKGMVNVQSRKRASNTLFGTDYTNAAPADFEKYGFLMSKDIIKQAKSGIAGQYWADGDGIQVRFKKNKVIATFTMEDSLGSGLVPSLITDPQLTSGEGYVWKDLIKGDLVTEGVDATRKYARSYIELQYHGDLTLDCVESVYVHNYNFNELKPATLDVMQKYGIILYTEINGNLCTYNFTAKRFETTIKGKPFYYDEKNGLVEIT